ncbi:MAG: hypothetical protein ACON4J_00190 [Parvibaculales bacterium]
MKILKYCVALCLSIPALPDICEAAAWLQPKGMLEVHYEHVNATHSEIFQGVENEFVRNADQLYVEYGWHAQHSLTFKHLIGSSGSGVEHEGEKFDLQEISLRSPLSAGKLRLLPPGIKPLWNILSPNPARRYGVASIDLGAGHNSNSGPYLIAQLNGAEKVETSHQNPLSIFFEISLNYQRYENANQGLKAISRLELGYRNVFLAYERLDGRFWGQTEFTEHFWFAEVGIPLTQTIILTAKRGHEHTLPGLPREQSTAFGLRLKLKNLP